MTVNIETADLITEYDKSLHFKDVYNYILHDKLPGNANTQKKIAGEVAYHVVTNQLLFKIEKVKQGKIYESIPLLVIPEKFEYNIFHMYHTSLLSMHQGLWKMFLTICLLHYIPLSKHAIYVSEVNQDRNKEHPTMDMFQKITPLWNI